MRVSNKLSQNIKQQQYALSSETLYCCNSSAASGTNCSVNGQHVKISLHLFPQLLGGVWLAALLLADRGRPSPTPLLLVCIVVPAVNETDVKCSLKYNLSFGGIA